MTLHIHRTARVLGAGLALALLLTSCVQGGRSGSSSASGEAAKCPWEPDTSVDTSATLAYQNVPNGDIVVKDLGILESCMPNAKVAWKNFPSGADVVQAFNSGSVDLGLAGSSPSTIAMSPPLDLPVSVVWIHDVIGDAEALVVRDKSITDITELKGEKIAVPFSSTTHYSLLQALTEAGMNPTKDVEVLNLQPESMPAAWNGDQIAAAWVWNPTLATLEQSGKVILSSADTADAGKPTFDLGLGDNAFIKDNPQFMVQWAKAEDYAVKMLNDDPDTAAESVAVALSLKSVDDAKALFDGLTYLPASEQASPQWLGGKLGNDLRSTAEFLKSQGEIKKVNPKQGYANAIDPKPAKEAANG